MMFANPSCSRSLSFPSSSICSPRRNDTLKKSNDLGALRSRNVIRSLLLFCVLL